MNVRQDKETTIENQEFQIGAYLTNGVEKIVKGAVRATLTDPKESAFIALQNQNVLMEEHSGGCVFFERRETVEALLAESAKK